MEEKPLSGSSVVNSVRLRRVGADRATPIPQLRGVVSVCKRFLPYGRILSLKSCCHPAYDCSSRNWVPGVVAWSMLIWGLRVLHHSPHIFLEIRYTSPT